MSVARKKGKPEEGGQQARKEKDNRPERRRKKKKKEKREKRKKKMKKQKKLRFSKVLLHLFWELICMSYMCVSRVHVTCACHV